VRRALALASLERPARTTVDELLRIATAQGCVSGQASGLLAEALTRASPLHEIETRLAALRASLGAAKPSGLGRARDTAAADARAWAILGAHVTLPAASQDASMVLATVRVARPRADAAVATSHTGGPLPTAGSTPLGRAAFTRLMVRARWCSADGNSLTRHDAFWVPRDTSATELELAFRLPPGRHRLALRVTDSGSGWTTTFLDEEVEIPVPGQTGPASAAPGLGPLAGQQPLDTLELRWTWDPVTGGLRANAEVLGSRIAAVRFELGGKPPVVSARAPFEASFDIGSDAPAQLLVAAGLDRTGEIVAADQVEVAQRPAGVSVRIVQPAVDAPFAGGFWVQAAVTAPPGQAAESVEVWLDDRLRAVLASPPWLHRVSGHLDRVTHVLRVVARFSNGEVAEDARLSGAHGYREAVEVQLREHWLVVEDAEGVPVTGLRADEIELSRGRERIERFRLLSGGEVPLSLALLVDTSATMLPNQDDVRTGLGSAIEDLLGERDRVALLEFDAELRTAVPFTDDLVWLREGIAALDSQGVTALYDSVARSLPVFHGTSGRRALLVVTDGFDGDSRLQPQIAARAVRRAGLPVYVLRVIGPSLPFDPAFDAARDGSPLATARHALEVLGRAGGGRVFDVRDEASLQGALTEIRRELNAQYLLLEESTDPGAERALTVRVLREGRYRARIRDGEEP
jgi:VWFA-related protein